MTFIELALEAYFFLPDSLMCYRKINDKQAVCYPQSNPVVVDFSGDTEVEYEWQRLRQCKADDCDLRHCKQCGGHNYEAEDRCDACQIEAASNETERLTRAFGGNYEEAARVMGW